MTRRWILLLAATVLVLAGGTSRAVEIPGPRPVSVVAGEGAGGAVAGSADAPASSLASADISRGPMVSRSESQQRLRLLTTALVGAALRAAATTRCNAVPRRLLELSIRSQTDCWRPAPGGRAPPRALTL